MSLPQIQSRTYVVDGASRRQGDRDLGKHLEKSKNDHQNHRPFRPNSSLGASTGAGQQHVNQLNSTFFGQSGSPKHSGDNKVEASAGDQSRDGAQEPLNQHLLYLTACLIGQLVEVQVKNGSIYSGVFHTSSAEKNYGIVLKIARLVRDGLSREKKSDIIAKDSTRRPVKTLVIQAKDLVQINAKDVPISGEMLQNGRARENRAEIVTDSFLSQGRHGEVERELKPWTPDNDDFRDSGLDSTFQNTWHRNWDQFEINRTLFGVESTFDEELYTTKLNRGPQSRDREREAWRIAREIEAHGTKKLHVVEERNETDDFNALDEESRFSSVLRPSDDEEIPEDDICYDETSNSSRQAATCCILESSQENFDEAEGRDFNKPDSIKFNDVDSLSSSMDSMTQFSDISPVLHKDKLQHTAGGDSNKRVMKVGGLTSHAAAVLVGDATSIQALNLDPGCPQVTVDVYRDFNEFRQQENAKRGKKRREDQVNELKSFSETLKDLTVKQQTTAIVGSNRKTAAVQASSAFSLPVSTSMSTSLSTEYGICAGSLIASSRSLSSGSSEGLIRVLSNEVEPVSDLSQGEAPVKQSLAQHSAETANVSPTAIPSTTTTSSPSSSSGVSTGADSFRRSTLNPYAKEFKLNPNAKSFMPTFTPRPPSPVVQTPVYVPGVLPPVAQLPNMPAGVGVSSVLQPGGQSATKYTPYNPVAVAPASGSNPYLPSPGTFTSGAGVTGTAVSPILGGGQSIKVPTQLQQSAVAAQAYGQPQPIRYTSSQAPAVHPTSTYIHPSGHVYSQQMMFGQPGQVVYIQPYPQAAPIPPPQSGQPSSQLQPKHRVPGTGVQGVQFCVAPSYIAGQQHFLPQVQVSQLSNPLQPTPGVLVPTTMSAIQPPRDVIGGTTQPNTGTNVVRVAGKFVGMNYQQ